MARLLHRRNVPTRMIASRQLNEIGGSMREVTVSFEAPRQRTRHWECRFLIKGLGRQQIHKALGEDSLQALLLAVEGARVTLDKIGRFAWLETDPDKAGPGIPRYIPTHQGPRFETRVNIAIERESKRYFQRILNARNADIAMLEEEVKGRREILGLLEGRLKRRRTRAVEFQTHLNEAEAGKGS